MSHDDYDYTITLHGNYTIPAPEMKFHPVQPGHISPYDYMWKLNFVQTRRGSFAPGICLGLYEISLNFSL